MSNIPVIGILNLFTVLALVFVAARLFARRKASPLVADFMWIFLIGIVLALLLVSPGILVKDLRGIQLAYNFADVPFLVMAAFTLRALFGIFPGTRNAFFRIAMPAAVSALGVASFVWKTALIDVSGPAFAAPLGNRFVIYGDSSPVLPNIITGLTFMGIFAAGAAIFFWQALRLTERSLRLRSFVIGLGFVFYVGAGIFGWLVGISPNLVYFFIFSGVCALLGQLTIAAGLLISPKKEAAPPQ